VKWQKIISRNTHIPIEKYDIFTTTEDFQNMLQIPIYEGERFQTKYNRLLGEIELTDIQSAKKGIPQIKVIFNIDKNGILNVTAEDLTTKKSKQITIKRGFLTSNEIDEMTKDAQKHDKEDKEFAKATQARQRLENYIENVKAQMTNKNIVNRIKAQDKKLINEKLRETTQFLREQDQSTSLDMLIIFKKLVQLKKVVLPIVSKLTGEKFDLDLLEQYDDNTQGEENNNNNNQQQQQTKKKQQ